MRRTLLLIALAGLSGCDKDTHNHPELITGKQLFDHHCAGCHAETGKGNFLKGVPPNKQSSLSIWQIAHKIRIEANDKRKMPLYPNMSTQEAELIADYVKQL
ncbi:c-type cytochrome [Alkalimarinus sediminis]|uniref:Cytochrome c n=1 Tax=Alkalimarinus sediminis TaxID=1632866 RepID=A0A9E8HF66_9ALTE|nr:cytochrome c [Alkalimarinus sediminis]UZW73329.1 cytochrome c [Alkalimarinus sediminis]